MEDALARRKRLQKVGRQDVLILVLMEDALALTTQTKGSWTSLRVLILVLMEDALALPL